MAVSIEFTSNDRKALRSIAKLETKIVGLEQKLKAAGTAGKTAGEKIGRMKGKATISKKMTGSLANYATGFIGIAAAVTVATKALTDFRKTQDEAASRITASERGRKLLSQVADSDPELFKKLRGTSAILRTTEGLGQVRADEIVFALQSAGFRRQALLFGSLENISFDPLAAIESAQKTQANFGGMGAGRTGGGTARQIINKNLAAALESPVTAGQIARASSIAATEFAAIGGGDEALSALVATLAKPFKTAQLGAERIKTLSAAVAAKRSLIGSDLEGLDLLFALPDLAEAGKLKDKKGKAVTSLDEFLGSKEAVSGLGQILKQRDEIMRVRRQVEQAELDTGTDRDLLTGALALVSSDPMLVSARQARIAKQRRELGEENKFGPTTLLANRFADDITRDLREADVPEALISLQKMNVGFLRFVFGDKLFLNAIGFNEKLQNALVSGAASSGVDTQRAAELGLAVPGVRSAAPEAQPVGDSLLPAAEKMNEAADKLLQAASRMLGGSTLGRVDDDPGAGARG